MIRTSEKKQISFGGVSSGAPSRYYSFNNNNSTTTTTNDSSAPVAWSSSSLANSRTFYNNIGIINGFDSYSSFPRSILKKEPIPGQPNDGIENCPSITADQPNEGMFGKTASTKLLQCFSCGRTIYGPKCQVQAGIWLHNDCFQCSTCGLQLTGVVPDELHLFSGKFYCGVHGEQMKQMTVFPQGEAASGVVRNSLDPQTFAWTGKKVGPATITSSTRNNSAASAKLGGCGGGGGRGSGGQPPPFPFQGRSSTLNKNTTFGTRKTGSIEAFNSTKKFNDKGPSIGGAGHVRKMLHDKDNTDIWKNNCKADASSAGRFAKSTESHSSVTDKPSAFSSTKIGKISAKFATKAFAEKDSADQFRSDKKIQNSSSEIPDDDHCALCNIKIVGSFVLAKGKSWCPEHFVCANSACSQRLIECGFIEAEGGKNYCPRCYDCLIAPSCHKCALPLIDSCLNALGKQWHPGCFCCTHCRKPFGSLSFYLENNEPYCEEDWNMLFTTKCQACRQPIKVGQHWIEALNASFHNTCFNCQSCDVNLEGQSFFERNNKPYCRAHARGVARG